MLLNLNLFVSLFTKATFSWQQIVSNLTEKKKIQLILNPNGNIVSVYKLLKFWPDTNIFRRSEPILQQQNKVLIKYLILIKY